MLYPLPIPDLVGQWLSHGAGMDIFYAPYVVYLFLVSDKWPINPLVSSVVEHAYDLFYSPVHTGDNEKNDFRKTVFSSIARQSAASASSRQA